MGEGFISKFLLIMFRRFNIFPKDKIFYELFKKQAEKLHEGAQVLNKILEDPANIKKYASEMKTLEQEADSIGHNVVDHLRRTFITPMEGEDIDLLRQKLDEVMDLMEKGVNRLAIYKVVPPLPDEIRQFIEILEKAIAEIEKGVQEIQQARKYQKKLNTRCKRLNNLENQADEVNRKALEKLMEVKQATPEKVLRIIELKEIYETFERAADQCEDLGNIFDSLAIKHR